VAIAKNAKVEEAKVDAKTTKLVKMVKYDDANEKVLRESDIHPDEVEGLKNSGWRLKK
jgi:hypothetical protein